MYICHPEHGPRRTCPHGTGLRFVGNSRKRHSNEKLHECVRRSALGLCISWQSHNQPDPLAAFRVHVCIMICSHVFNMHAAVQVAAASVTLRVAFLCLLLSARHCYYVVEHPMQSLICRHPRWEILCNQQQWVTW